MTTVEQNDGAEQLIDKILSTEIEEIELGNAPLSNGNPFDDEFDDELDDELDDEDYL